MEMVSNLIDKVLQHGGAWLTRRRRQRQRYARCDRIDVDVWQHVFSFLAPASLNLEVRASAGAAATPALSMDEIITRAPARKSRFYFNNMHVKTTHENTTLTTTWLGTINALRCVSKGWREFAPYDRQTPCLYLRCNWLLRDTLPNDFAQRFRACRAITIDGFGKTEKVEIWPTSVEIDRPRFGCHHLPEALRQLVHLRSLSLQCMRLNNFHFPRWFGQLPLVELSIHYPREQGVEAEDRAWERDPNILPKTLEVLRFSADTEEVSLECVRLLPRLRELNIGSREYSTGVAAPAWFHELTSLRRLEMVYGDPVDWSPELRQMDLVALDFSVEMSDNYNVGEEPEFLAALDGLFVNTRCGASLRELHISGYDGLRRVPDALRSLTHLQHLDLSGNADIDALPDWVGELPLVVLNLSWTNLRTLPTSLRATRTLRFLELVGTSWLSGSIRRYRYGVVMVLDGEEVPLGEATADAVARIDGELQPLSLALPDLRFRLHERYWDQGWERLGEFPRTWWHAGCGVHWTDPSFYYFPWS